ncbi:hypothetical protein P153DRAFT_320188 [Dothidotthia symphoricarpi CBS 119687]|uniref:Family c-likeg-protein-coupled receptor protein n=1 Tax=Dothidotthia symphoricarpi CBS 119687 TaxID=1392245 RepID=A0A6A6A7D1_9PLEO|nr:uncharacterized protein P153DRAFT_320188 [Dothidotthia symphoricarpi CBS 119687]KAF2127740.1 hypothetical protein P153DRAFT_320188 [Dothidotthia symphoricarpi CBS 119687]
MASQGVNAGAGTGQTSSAPYLPTTWALGGLNKRHIDLPITCILLVCYIGSAVTHMTILQLNRKRGHKFLFNGALFGFSMSRIVTCTLRIASICIPRNARLGIAAAIFIAAGVLIIFIINVMWSIRIVRSLHPHFGWHPAVGIAMKVLYVTIGLTLAAVIVATVQSFYTLDTSIRHVDRSLQLYGQTFLAVVSCAPIIILAIAFAIPRRSAPEKFGAGRLRTKVIVLLVGTTLVSMGAWYRCGTSWQTPVPRTQPMPVYFHKAAFYCFIFVNEILTSYLYAIMRVDLRFWIPNGAKGPGDYESCSSVAAVGSLSGSNEEAALEKEGQGVNAQEV